MTTSIQALVDALEKIEMRLLSIRDDNLNTSQCYTIAIQALADYHKSKKEEKFTKDDMFKAMSWAITERKISEETLPVLTLPETNEEKEEFGREWDRRIGLSRQKIDDFFKSLDVAGSQTNSIE